MTLVAALSVASSTVSNVIVKRYGSPKGETGAPTGESTGMYILTSLSFGRAKSDLIYVSAYATAASKVWTNTTVPPLPSGLVVDSARIPTLRPKTNSNALKMLCVQE